MYEIATQTTFPSWGHQIARGATTLWETWEGDVEHSFDMKMFGSVGLFLFRDLGGISPLEPGYRRMAIRPHVARDLTYVQASQNTVRGSLRSTGEETVQH